MDAIFNTIFYGFDKVSHSFNLFDTRDLKYFSLLVLRKSKKLSKKQEEEVKRRSYTYLSYLLRSPVYDTCTKYELFNRKPK